jgi:hypothetical protein
MSEVFVPEPWKVEIDRRGVRITYRSDTDVFVRRMSRADYRTGLEVSLRQLNEYELRERCEVVPLRKGKRGH